VSSNLKATLDRHNREVDGFYDMAGGSSKGAAGDLFSSGRSSNNAASLLQGTDNKYAEQYGHYKSWPYVAIRAISHRVAGQQILMARRAAGSAQERARFIMAQKSGVDMRRMKDWESEKLPPWIKGHMGFEGELITNHELLDAIRRPNQMMTHWSLMVCTVASIELTGRSFWYISRDDEDNINIWPLPTNWVTPVHGDGSFKEYIVQPGGGGDKYVLDADQVAYFSLPDPANPMGSFSPVQAQIRAIETDEAIQMAQDVSFKRGIFPGMMLMTGRLPGVGGQPGMRPVLTADQRKQLYNAVFSAYEGVAHYGEPLIVDGMIEGVEKFTTTPAEMDFQASGKITKSRILQAFGVNPIILGEVENANRAQAAVAEENFCNNVVNPLLELMSQVMTAYLSPIVDDKGEVAIWIDPTHPHDREQRLKEWTEAAKIGAISVNEFRTKMLNLPPMEGGDIALRPMNFEQVDVSTGGRVQAGHSRGGLSSPKEARAKQPAALASMMTGGIQLTEQDVYDIHVKQIDKAQEDFRKEAEKLFRLMYKSAADALDSGRHSLHSELASELFDPKDWRDELEQTVGVAWMRAAIEGAVTELTLYDYVVQKEFEFEPTDQVLIDIPPKVLSGLTAELDFIFEQPYWEEILTTTSLDIQGVINAGIQGGMSIGEVERMMRNELSGGRHPAVRANAMARTEMGGAVNAGHQKAMESLASEGLVTGKQWLSVCGGTTRQDHCAANMQEVEVDALFLLGDEECPYPAHGSLSAHQRVNCQCMHISVTIASNLKPGETLADVLAVPPTPPVATLEVASSLRQAESLAAQNLTNVGKANYSNVSLSSANRINKTLQKMQNTGAIKGKKTFNVEAFTMAEGDTVGGSFQMLKYSTDDALFTIAGNYDDQLAWAMKKERASIGQVKRRHTLRLKKIKVDMEKYEAMAADVTETPGMREWAESQVKNLVAQREGNEQLLKDFVFTNEQVAARVAKKVSVRAVTMEDAIIHEYGHVLNSDLQVSASLHTPKVRAILQKIKRQNGYEIDYPNTLYGPRHSLWDAQAFGMESLEVSEYAATNGAEYFAESWLKFHQTGKVDDKLLQELFEELTR
tara:strand:- start:16762 stop:20028 length:3267 start_codon:yes stop_codon:yes gene_type:complete